MRLESIKNLIDQIEYRNYLKSLDSILINKENSLIDEIDNIILSGNYLFECGISCDDYYGIGIVIPAGW